MNPRLLLALLLVFLLALRPGVEAAETPSPAGISSGSVPTQVSTPAPQTPAVLPPAASVDAWVSTFNPDIYGWDPATKKPTYVITDTFGSPASDVARKLQGSAAFSFLVFVPFLILPQVLLLYIIFRFRDRGDGRKAEKTKHNTKLEIIWTAIPFLALAIVTVPSARMITWMELPPPEKSDPLLLEVRGSKFKWEYTYQREDVKIGQDAGVQAHVVLPVGRPVVLNITSDDVNHAWWVPAFGIKKDAIIGRYTNAWFTPDTTGVYKGQCAELCGTGHGLMMIGAVVVTPAEFQRWIGFQRQRAAAGLVAEAAVNLKKAPDETALTTAIAKYLDGGADQERLDALAFWVANDLEGASRTSPLAKRLESRAADLAARTKVAALVAAKLGKQPIASLSLSNRSAP